MNRRIRDSFNDVKYLCRNTLNLASLTGSSQSLPRETTFFLLELEAKVLSRQTPKQRRVRKSLRLFRAGLTVFQAPATWQVCQPQSTQINCLWFGRLFTIPYFFRENHLGLSMRAKLERVQNARGKNSGNCDCQLCLHIFLRSSNQELLVQIYDITYIYW